jgi:Aspartyl protease
VMAGQVVAMDPTPLAKFDKIRTAVLPPGDARIPKTSRHVPLTAVDFSRFTRLSPAGAAGPNLIPNPMIGPNPFAANDAHQPVTITYHGKTASGTFLLDTGAAASVISTKMAKELGLQFDANGEIVGVPADQQFELAIGGVGGAKQSHGLFFDRLELPTLEQQPVVYVKAPLLISDITVADSSGKTFTLDGVFGMNYLVSSAEITGGLLPDVGKIVDGPWRWIVIDFKLGEMGLEPK